MIIHRFPKERLAFETAKKISAILEQEQEKDVLLLLAGGSAFEVYDSILPRYLSSRLTIAMTDDRFSQEMDINNSHILQATDFYNECINSDAFFISTEVWGEEKLEELAARFEKGLRKWHEEFPDGLIIAVFGMGEDGHTCGIIPEAGKNADEKSFKERFDDPKKWTVGYVTPQNEFHERVSITFPFIRQFVDHAVAYISGEKKRAAFDQLLSEKGSLAQTPVRILRELKDVDVFTDMAEK